MDHGNHIGEFLKVKLKKKGRTATWLAKQLNTSKQNMVHIFDKHEMLPSKVKMLEKILEDDHFFDEFFENNNLAKYYGQNRDSKNTVVNEDESMGSNGYTLSIQIDPENFNSKKVKHLIDIMEEVSKKLK